MAIRPRSATQSPTRAAGGVIRITVDLIQVDAVATDSKGRPVRNLKPEDFEILEDRRPQRITNFSYVTVAGPAASVSPRIKEPPLKAGATGPVPAAPLRPEQVRRTIAVVVDDIGLSFESTYEVRQTLKKFVDDQMQPGDLVAILRTAGGLGALQQFTNDKRMLSAAVDRIRWHPTLGGRISTMASLEPDSADENSGGVARGQRGGQPTGPSMPTNLGVADRESGRAGHDLHGFTQWPADGENVRERT